MTSLSRPRRVVRGRIAMSSAVAALVASVLGGAGLAAQRSPGTLASSVTGAPIALSLAEAVRLATGTSEQITIARAGSTRARGQVYQARSGFFPQLSTGLNYQKTLQNQFQAISNRTDTGNGGNGTGSDTTGGGSLADNPLTRIFASPYTTTFTLTASQAIYTGGRTSALVRAANAGREAAAIGLTSAQAQVALTVTSAYYDALLAEDLVTIAESTLVQTERTFRQVQLSKNVGATSEFEAIRASVTRDNQRPVWLQSRTSRDLAYDRLRQLLDLPLTQRLELTDRPLGGTQAATIATTNPSNNTSGGVNAIPITNVNVDPAEALRIDPAVEARTREAVTATDTTSGNRAPVRQASKSVEIARQTLRSTRAQRLPTIGVSTTYQRLAYPSDGLPRSLADFFPNWTAGFSVSFPFFTGGRVRGEILAAEAGVLEAQAQLKLVEKGAALDARQAIAELEQAEATLQASLGTESQATRAYSIAEVRFKEGISTQLELSETRVQLQQALANRARASRDLAVARVRLQLLPNLPLGTSSGSATPGANAAAAGATGGGASGGAGAGAGAAGGSAGGAGSGAAGAGSRGQQGSSSPTGNTP